ncbi:hypothetical protein MKZ38_003611 [Zalerion maritima]|uniref:Uncharacterized protein n=1 Tax=Zalerion maritima TaxID=339359 RepID=A0AAD5RN86_9PEZI|nr:hypothetical protein MKZ38_003611 [Zalerion maritima]
MEAGKSDNATTSAIWIALVICAGLSVVVWFASPKGPDRLVWRSVLIGSIICMYLMWMITYMAQLHPLIAPKRSDLRAEAFHHGGVSL